MIGYKAFKRIKDLTTYLKKIKVRVIFKELELIIELISITYCELPGTTFEGEVTAELVKITNYARLGNLHENLSEVFKPMAVSFISIWKK